MFRILCLAVGYAFGLFNTALVLGRILNVDIRKHGSGNAGTTNMLRVMGPKAGFTVLGGDMLKAIIPVLLLAAVLGRTHPDLGYLIKAWTGLGVVLGHNFPFYAHFKGGKGIATTGGIIIAYDWRFVPFGLLAFLLPFWITHYVSLGSLVMTLFFLVAVIITAQTGICQVPETARAELYCVVAVITAMAFVMHRENIRKLLSGTERKTYIFKKNKVD